MVLHNESCLSNNGHSRLGYRSDIDSYWEIKWFIIGFAPRLLIKGSGRHRSNLEEKAAVVVATGKP